MKRALSHSRFIVILATYSLDPGEVGTHVVEVYRSKPMKCPDALMALDRAIEKHPAPGKRNPTGRKAVADRCYIRDDKTGREYSMVSLYQQYYGAQVVTGPRGEWRFPLLYKNKPKGKT